MRCDSLFWRELRTPTHSQDREANEKNMHCETVMVVRLHESAKRTG